MKYSSPIQTPSPPVLHWGKCRRKARNGRLYVFLLFLWLRTIDAAMLFYLYPQLSSIYQHDLVASLVTTAVWTSGLFLAIWFHQNWAKYILVACLLLAVVSTLSMLPSLPDTTEPMKKLWVILGVTGIYLPVALILMLSQQIHKLTRTQRE